jgi:hypothetical protein
MRYTCFLIGKESSGPLAIEETDDAACEHGVARGSMPEEATAMAKRHIGEHVQLRSGKTGRIRAVLQQASLAMHCRYQVLIDGTNTQIGINGLDILDPCPERYFAQQRTEVQLKLGQSGAEKIAKFRERIDEIRTSISRRQGLQVGNLFVEERDPTRGKAVVFMGLKTVPEPVAGAIHKYGLTALKYLKDAAQVDQGYITAGPQPGQRDNRQAASFRVRFLTDCQTISRAGDRWLEFQLLQLANAHKSGPGVTVSGFHSTSGKPEYAAEYTDGTGEMHGRPCYNIGVAMEISDSCCPLSIQGAIEQWNALANEDRYGKPAIELAFKKEEVKWKHDYESEILLGGATPPADIVFFCCYTVTRSATNFSSGLGAGLLGKMGNLNKTDRDTTQ